MYLCIYFHVSISLFLYNSKYLCIYVSCIYVSVYLCEIILLILWVFYSKKAIIYRESFIYLHNLPITR